MAELVKFTCGGREFVMESRSLRAVVEDPALCPVPMTPGVVAGVFNWRGKVQTVLDPAFFAGGACTSPRYALVLDHPDGEMAICAEAVGKTFHVEGQDGIESAEGSTVIEVHAFVEAVKAEVGGAEGERPTRPSER